MALQSLTLGRILGFLCHLEKTDQSADLFLTLRKEEPETKVLTVITYDFDMGSNGIIRELEYRRTLDSDLYSGKDTPLRLHWKVGIVFDFAELTSNSATKKAHIIQYLKRGHNTFAADALSELKNKKRIALEDKFSGMLQKAADFNPEFYDRLRWV